MLFVSGQIPLNPITGNLEMATIEEATNRVMLNIKALLEAADMQMNQIVKCSIFLKDLNNFSSLMTSIQVILMRYTLREKQFRFQNYH